jgi:hypothetical protein
MNQHYLQRGTLSNMWIGSSIPEKFWIMISLQARTSTFHLKKLEGSFNDLVLAAGKWSA